MHTFEITIQRRSGDRWPVVVELTAPGALLPSRREGVLALDLEELEAAAPEDYGVILGRALFVEDVRDAFKEGLGRGGAQLRVLLYVEDEALKARRWERLGAPLDGGWKPLALDQRTPFALHLPSVTDRQFAPIGRLDLRALIVVANPLKPESWGLTAFDVAAAVRGVRESLDPIPTDVLADVAGADGPPTLDALCAALTGRRDTLLHVVAHGRFARDDKEPILFLATAEGGVDPVSTSRLLERLGHLREGRGLPHFAFLCTCESADPAAEGVLGGLGQRLVRALGMPAVVAMTDKVSVPSALALASAFYRRLRQHGEVDLALTESYAGLAGRPDIRVPVPALFSRLGGRPLFSDADDRELTAREIAHGLQCLADLLPDRAPILRPSFAEHATALRGTLALDDADLTETARAERQRAQAGINELCGEVLDLSFRALALGKGPPPYDARCPFRGLYPFRVEDHEFFFGREEMVAQLEETLGRAHFLAVLGASGSGKSSVVLAGLLPGLRSREPDLRLATMTPGRTPLARLEASLAAAGGSPGVLVIDQLEEIFTLCTVAAERRAFFDRLLALTEAMRVVVTMRADFWGDCAPYPSLSRAMLAHQRLIAPMGTAELRRAMESQAAAVGLRFEAELVNTLLDHVGGEPGAMPLLQHTLFELWNRRHGRWLRGAEYRALGGVQKAIAHTADAVYRDLALDDRERVRVILLRLTRLDEGSTLGEERRDTRQRVGFEELVPAGADPSAIRRLVGLLADARLVVTSVDPTSGRQQVEVAHEALIRHWPLLRGWLVEDRENLRLRQRIRQEVRDWADHPQDVNYLMLRRRQLRAARDLAGQLKYGMNEQEIAYIRACEDQDRIEDLRRNRSRWRVLEDAGWGVIFAHDADPAIREALEELLAHRKRQATTQREPRYREFTGDAGYRPGESKRTFLARHGVGSGPCDPDRMPYYLLIVGDPEAIPFEFQYQLDVEYAVGRIHFETVDAYARYARSVVTAETRPLRLPRRAVFFGPLHSGDRATQLSVEHLVTPLAEDLARAWPTWEVGLVRGDEATKARLRTLLGGDQLPALLFTAGHGMGFPNGDQLQLPHQGALLCRDWPGVGRGRRPITPDFYFAAEDVAEDARLSGLLAFFWSCYSGGTPRWDDYSHEKSRAKRTPIAARSFVARLPQHLLSHPGGGALAVVGRIERSWGFSFWEMKIGRNLGAFRGALERLMDGDPVGLAIEPFNRRYGELASEFHAFQEEQEISNTPRDVEIASLRTAMKDARNYVVIGDPAVRVMVGEASEDPTDRPTIAPLGTRLTPPLGSPSGFPPPLPTSPRASPSAEEVTDPPSRDPVAF
jgi:hypothetical protein